MVVEMVAERNVVGCLRFIGQHLVHDWYPLSFQLIGLLVVAPLLFAYLVRENRKEQSRVN